MIKRKHSEKPVIAEHYLTTSHKINFDDTKLLHLEENYTKRKIKESLEIIKNRDNFNRDGEYNIN